MSSGRLWTKLLILLIAVYTLSGCKTGRRPVQKDLLIDSTVAAETLTPSAETIVTPTLNAEKKALVDLLLPLQENRIQFQTFSGKAKAFFQGGNEKYEFTAGIRMQKDSVVWISVSGLGGLVQVARLMLTPDSVYLINYLQREVTILPASEASRLLPADVNFQMVQSLIIGNLLSNGGVPTDASDFGGTWSLQLEDNQYRQLIAYNKLDTTMRSNQVLTRTAPETGLMLQFGNYEWINNQRFPISRVINISTGEAQYYLDMHFNSVSIDEPIDFPFSIPKKYTLK
jgi:hypothetical protein